MQNGQGYLASARGEHGRAEDLHHAALAAHLANGFALAVVDSLEALAGWAVHAESWAEGVRLYAATGRRSHELGYRPPGVDASAREGALTAARAGLGEESFAECRAEGSALSIEAAVAYTSRARGERKRPSSGWASLTPTELAVVALAVQGHTNAEIGRRMFISLGTAKFHLSRVYTKVGLANRAELAAEATRRGI